MYRLVFGVSGASGIPLAQNMLEFLQDVPQVQVHLVISPNAVQVCRQECGCDIAVLEQFSHTVYAADDMSAGPSSGSWEHCGMIVCPCSMRSLAAIASGVGENLIHRAADVCMKERRPLILVARETPLSLIHLRNMTRATEVGATIMPFAPAFYTSLGEIPDMITIMRQFTGRVLDQLHIPHTLCNRWKNNT